jgi:hypothetical protein
MPGPPTTSSSKNAGIKKQGHTTTGKYGDEYAKKRLGGTEAREIPAKG